MNLQEVQERFRKGEPVADADILSLLGDANNIASLASAIDEGNRARSLTADASAGHGEDSEMEEVLQAGHQLIQDFLSRSNES